MCVAGGPLFTVPEVAFVADFCECYARMNSRAKNIEVLALPLDTESRPLFDAAFREHYSPLLQYLRRRLGSEADARDIAQEAYLRLLRYRENQDLNSLKALLFRIASNLVGMRARLARTHFLARHQALDDQESLIHCGEPSHEQRLIGEQQLERLMEAIQSLPTKCQRVFILSRFHDMSYPEIAARCGITVKMVEKHVTKALGICRTKVGDTPQ
jgi:RNA polymerase sigma factor (sigma-70 family)